MNDILGSGFLHYTTVGSLEMSDEPKVSGMLSKQFMSMGHLMVA